MAATQPGAGWTESAPLQDAGSPRTHAQARARDGTLNTSSNIVLLYRMHELRGLAFVNFVLALLTLLYLAMNLVLLFLTLKSYKGDGAILHHVEFWSTFFYACVEAFALIYTPRAISSISGRPTLLKVLLFFDVVATFCPAVLVTLNLEEFETIAHQIEYLNELTMAFVNLVLLASLLRSKVDAPVENDTCSTYTITLAALAIACVQLALYDLFGMKRMAHVFEFSFGTVSAFVTFAFCLDNRALAEDEVLCIMYGDHRDCPNCNVRHKSKAALKHRARSLSGDGRGPYNSFGDVGAGVV